MSPPGRWVSQVTYTVPAASMPRTAATAGGPGEPDAPAAHPDRVLVEEPSAMGFALLHASAGAYPEPMMFSWGDSRTAFADAAGWFVHTAALVGDRWDRPGLGEWDVRALVGHTSRALLTVETYLARPAAAVNVATAPDYYRATRATAADPAVVARGRDAGTALGSDPAAAVAQIAARVLAL